MAEPRIPKKKGVEYPAGVKAKYLSGGHWSPRYMRRGRRAPPSGGKK